VRVAPPALIDFHAARGLNVTDGLGVQRRFADITFHEKHLSNLSKFFRQFNEVELHQNAFS
jgi:hypothetical protein